MWPNIDYQPVLNGYLSTAVNQSQTRKLHKWCMTLGSNLQNQIFNAIINNFKCPCLCMCQRASWTYPPQVFTSIHFFNKIIRSRFTISSPFSYNNWVKIHCRKNKVGWRFTFLADLFFVGQDSLLNKQNNETIKRTFFKITVLQILQTTGTDSSCSKINKVKIHQSTKSYTSKIWRRDGVESLTTLEEGWVQGTHWRLH